MRWSERPPAARSQSALLERPHSDPRALSVAVAHLILVRPVILRAYEYLFYRLYHFWRALWPRDAPEWSAFFMVVFVTWWNIFTLLSLLALFRRGPFWPTLSRPQVYGAMALVALPQYFLLLHRRRFERFDRKFAHETVKQRRVRGVLVLLYVSLSFPLLICAAVVRLAIAKA